MIACPCRLQILGCHVISKTTTTTNQKEVVYQSSGQLQRPFCTGNTVLKVMCGVMEWSCMRYGHLDTNHSKSLQLKRYNIRYKVNSILHLLCCKPS